LNLDEPVFAEPWQAHAFALAVKLSQAGLFSWNEWSVALGEELAQASRRGEPDDGSRYYHHWLTALERLVADKGLAAPLALLARKREWEEAYRRTPHGKPVVLNDAEPTPSPTLPGERGAEGWGQGGEREEAAQGQQAARHR
jgi:nitrile hydratase accessory protein